MKLAKNMTGRKRINMLVSAGATAEPIDPVRFISNRATGFLGCEIARQAKKRGHRVILVCAALKIDKPKGVAVVDVLTARQMQAQIRKRFKWCDCLIMNAAVCDFRPREISRNKIKKGRQRDLTLTLKPNPDILAEFGSKKGKKRLIGFALETERLKQNAQDKLRRKNLDLIVATQIKTESYPFGKVRMDSLLMDKKNAVRRLKGVSKPRLARILLDSIEKIMLS